MTAEPFAPPRALEARLDIRRDTFATWPVFTVRPRGGQPGGTFFYVHGGGHVTELSPPHWQFIDQLVLATGWSAVVPVFPLAPEATHREVQSGLRELYLAETSGRMAVVGDSSGGGVALALVQQLPSDRRPEDLILLSPWLDATLDNPEIPALEPLDPFSTREGLLRFARLFAGADPLSSAQLSPIRGRLDDLGNVTVFVGGADILTPDARLLRASAGPGTEVDLREYPDKTHMWMLLSEADGAVIAKEIQKTLSRPI